MVGGVARARCCNSSNALQRVPGAVAPGRLGSSKAAPCCDACWPVMQCKVTSLNAVAQAASHTPVILLMQARSCNQQLCLLKVIRNPHPLS